MRQRPPNAVSDQPARRASLWQRAAKILRQRHGNVVWDGLVRGSGLVSLMAIPAVLHYPKAGVLTGFVLMTIWINGPWAPLLPATYEPVLMLFGRMYPPVQIAALGIAGTLYVEFLNYHLYRRVLQLQALSRIREGRLITRLSGLYRRAPFVTIWLCSWSPLPYWLVRFLSPLIGYPVGKHLVATFLGRFPRLWFFAALGLFLPISGEALAAIAAASILLAVVAWSLGGRGGRVSPGQKLSQSSKYDE